MNGKSEAALRVGVGPVDQRQPDHDQEEDEQVDDEIDTVVLYPEERESHWSRSRPWMGKC
jgi:hypothetical protein